MSDMQWSERKKYMTGRRARMAAVVDHMETGRDYAIEDLVGAAGFRRTAEANTVSTAELLLDMAATGLVTKVRKGVYREAAK